MEERIDEGDERGTSLSPKLPSVAVQPVIMRYFRGRQLLSQLRSQLLVRPSLCRPRSYLCCAEMIQD